MAKLTVILLGNELVTQNEDDLAAEAITPGHLVNYDSNGDLVKHATAGGAASMWALEREELGQDMNTDYAINDTVKVGCAPTGVRVNAIIASGQNITKGQFLESAGNGTLKVYSAGYRVAQAVESSGAVTAATRLRVQII